MANGETLTAANAAQDNPVGIIEKYIYIIRNYINDKVYIGQAIDPEDRFKGHIIESRLNRNNSAIDGAIAKYGAENFYYEILEDKTPDYNERERYWIAFYKSKCPNGYNILDGGEDPPIRYGTQNNKCKLSEEDVDNIRRLLLNPSVTMREIAIAYGVSYKSIKNINIGETHHDESIIYPIRQFQLSGEIDKMLSQQIVSAIIFDIINTNLSFRRIAAKYKANENQVKNINEGVSPAYHKDWLVYPLRESTRITKKQVDQIKQQLMDGTMSKNQIASKNGVKYAIVTAINSGRHYFDENLVYPLKKHEGRLDLGDNVFEDIRKRLKRGDNPKTIASQLHLPNVSIVYDINAGKTHRSNDYQYPIRVFEPAVTDETVRKIAERIFSSTNTFATIAKEFGVNKSTVQQVNVGKYARYKLPNYNYPIRSRYR